MLRSGIFNGMSHSIIEVENLSKRYRLGVVGATTLSEDLRRLGRKLRGEQPAPDLNEFWALRDVSFNVQPGEVVGIIGRNGAGKSTLLKILSRVTEPTSGRVRLRGRVASLLEVGTGFHPDLTGRENVFLNGAILGMKRAEIAVKFDEIVAFAEVEKFIDTPVKHYSSGMRVRLAFAVAAHLDPEILIIDEVLAVGDNRFQDKCLGKIQSIAGQQGRTVLFVSHNMEAVDKLTQRCVYLRDGLVESDGPTLDVVARYLADGRNGLSNLENFRVSPISRLVGVRDLWAETSDGRRSGVFRQGEKFRLGLTFESRTHEPVDAAIVVENDRHQALFTTHLGDGCPPVASPGVHRFGVTIEKPTLRRGHYAVSIALFSPDKATFYDVIHHLPLFEIAGTTDPRIPDDIRWGDLYFHLPWSRMDDPI